MVLFLIACLISVWHFARLLRLAGGRTRIAHGWLSLAVWLAFFGLLFLPEVTTQTPRHLVVSALMLALSAFSVARAHRAADRARRVQGAA
ncbi:MAG: hypothetical protein SFU56_13910 [Capsulimonadales bacterium]|nr:hypothetical protein [Capsulimonadales bacterium]